MAQNKSNDLIDDLSDIEEGSNLYEICENKKLNGASNAELREYLRDNNVLEDEIRAMIRQIDSDFLSGKITKKPSQAEGIAAIVVGTILIIVGCAILFIQLIMGFISLWLIILSISMITTGTGMAAYKKLFKNRL